MFTVWIVGTRTHGIEQVLTEQTGGDRIAEIGWGCQPSFRQQSSIGKNSAIVPRHFGGILRILNSERHIAEILKIFVASFSKRSVYDLLAELEIFIGIEIQFS